MRVDKLKKLFRINEMLNKFYLLLIASVFILGGCTHVKSLFHQSPEIVIKEKVDINEIAVITFSKQGSMLPQNIEKFAADKLTDALFLKGKYNIIDRSKVNSAQQTFGINSPENLSSDQIQMIGLKLKANYIVLGRIQSYGGVDYIGTDEERKLSLSIRIISVLNSETVATINASCKYEENDCFGKIESLINEIVSGMKPE